MSLRSLGLKRSQQSQESEEGEQVAHGLNAMGWRELQSLASKAQVLKRGMDRGQIVAALLTEEAQERLNGR